MLRPLAFRVGRPCPCVGDPRVWSLGLVALACVGLTERAAAQVAMVAAEPAAATSEASPDPCTPRPVQELEAVPVIAALVPGVLLHGAGHWAACRKATGYRLLATQGMGMALTLASGTTIVVTGAARQLVGPAAMVLGVGAGMFVVSWLADLWGVTVPERLRGTPRLRVPHLELELGTRLVHDPQFDYGTFASAGAHARWHALRLTAEADVALYGDNQRMRLEAAYRLWGPGALPRATAADGSFFEASGALMYHRFGAADFASTTAEVFGLGRLDLQRFDPALVGSFVELGLGGAFRVVHYGLPTARPRDDSESLLLMRVAFGAYLGRGDGEAMLYYDHRHDDFAGGMILGGLGSGVIGHAGLSGFYYFAERWGVGLDLQRGAAYVAQLTARYRLPTGAP